MSSQKITDDELRVAARELLDEGALTFRALKARVGGDSGRVSRIIREVRSEHETRTKGHVQNDNQADASGDEMPAALRAEFARLERCTMSAIASLRQEAHAHALQSEQLLIAKHASELDAAHNAKASLEAQLVELEDAATEQAREVEELSSALMDARAAVDRGDDERRAMAEVHVTERHALTAVLEAAQEGMSGLRDECRAAEAAVRQAQADNLRLDAELTSTVTALQSTREAAAAADRRADAALNRVSTLERELAEVSAKLEASDSLRRQLEAVLRSSQVTRAAASKRRNADSSS